MNVLEMLSLYERFNKAEKYIIGFAYKHKIYMLMVDSLDSNMITLESASKNQGVSLRFRPHKADKLALMERAVCIGDEELVLDEKYNKGEMFEKVVTEYYGQEWVKDTVPFHKAGDIVVSGVQIQIKFEKAALCTSKTLDKLLAA